MVVTNITSITSSYVFVLSSQGQKPATILHFFGPEAATFMPLWDTVSTRAGET